MPCVQHWQYFLVGPIAVLVWVGWGVVGGLVWLVSDPEYQTASCVQVLSSAVV